MPKNLRFDAANSRCVAYEPLPPGMNRQLQRLAVERRPEACLGCGFENGCSLHGCAVLRRVSRVVAMVEGGKTAHEEDVH